mmetsp:Transcript_12283/g.29715  ORF Transcript_12283/g.29715 Transcript_12283/m.29715 type:complete len:253 (+) Transcript_12283:536-1294(+)
MRTQVGRSTRPSAGLVAGLSSCPINRPDAMPTAKETATLRMGCRNATSVSNVLASPGLLPWTPAASGDDPWTEAPSPPDVTLSSRLPPPPPLPPPVKSSPLSATISRLIANMTTTRTSFTTVTLITSEQNGPRPSISRSTAMALAGDRATPRVAASDATAYTWFADSFDRNPTWLPTTTNAANTKNQVKAVMHPVITSAGFGFFRSSDSNSSDPAATPITARHRLSSTARRSVATLVSSPSTCCPDSTPVMR